MTAPNPRSKLLPARGNLASLQAELSEILEGELCYAFDKDQYYQKEGGVLVPVSVEEAPSDGSEYVRKDGAWAVSSGGGGGSGNIGAGSVGRVPYYAANGTTVTASSQDLTWDNNEGELYAKKINADEISTIDTGIGRISSGGDLYLSPDANINADGNVIRNVATPIESSDATNRGYVDQKFNTVENSYPKIGFTFVKNSGENYEVTGAGIPFSPSVKPTLVLQRGLTYHFINDAGADAPLYIKTVPNTSGTSNQYLPGVTSDPAGTTIFVVPFTAPDRLYYQDQGKFDNWGTIVCAPDLNFINGA